MILIPSTDINTPCFHTVSEFEDSLANLDNFRVLHCRRILLLLQRFFAALVQLVRYDALELRVEVEQEVNGARGFLG